MGGGLTLPYSINLSLNGQTLVGPSGIQFLVQNQDMDLNDHLAKKSTLHQALFLDNFPRYSPTRNWRILGFWSKFLEFFCEFLEFFVKNLEFFVENLEFFVENLEFFTQNP